ncbi:alginate lyase family protein [Ureibacillus sp. NPDC094379]
MRNQIEIAKNMGLRWTTFRVKYEVLKKLGHLKKEFPQQSYDSILSELDLSKNDLKRELSKSFKRLFKTSIIKPLGENSNEIINQAELVMNNKFTYFSKFHFDYKEINWNYSPATKKFAPKDKHWSEIADLNSDFGDIKWIWELSRFTFAYPLAQAYVITKDEKYPEKFWLLFEDFTKNNPLECGVNYKCGQEISLRLMAWIYAFSIFFDSPTLSEDRLKLLVKTIYHHADHVNRHISFALESVKNNHSISEAMGIYTIGSLFPMFDKAEEWKTRGKKFLEREISWQIYEDGSYIQHSFNYQRLVIQDITWVLTLASKLNDKFSKEFYDKFEKTILFLYNFQSGDEGRVPNYGMNDGAYIQPLTVRPYLDYRPVLQAAWIVLKSKRLYNERLSDEIAIWLGLNTNVELDNIVRDSKYYENGGYLVSRKNNQLATMRCTSYKHRPHQADMLHVDFWVNEHNILADAGTFSYNTDLETIKYFNGTKSHNTILLNELDQMTKVSRFIWLNWTKSKVHNVGFTKDKDNFEGEHFGYKPSTHRRNVLHSESCLVIEDKLELINESTVSLSWLFGVKNVTQLDYNTLVVKLPNNETWEMTVDIIEGKVEKLDSNLYLGSTKPMYGWISNYYGDKEEFPQLVFSFKTKGNVKLKSTLKKIESYK